MSIAYRSTCRPTHDRESVDMSTDISVEHRSMCRPTGDRSVGRDIDRHIGRGVCKLHMILLLSTLLVGLFLVFLMFTHGKQFADSRPNLDRLE